MRALAIRPLSIAVAFVAVSVASGQVISLPSDLKLALSPNMSVVSPSNLTFSADVDTSFGDDSDSDNALLSGTAEATFDVRFSSGNLEISDFYFTGGTINVDEQIDLDFSFFLVSLSADGTGLKGTPATIDPPTTLSPAARPGTVGQFLASKQAITVNQGNIAISGLGGLVSENINLASEPIEGASTSSTPGTVTVTQGTINVAANTTSYSLTVNEPVQFTSDPIDLSGAGTATVTVSGTFRAAVSNLVFDWIPTNGIAGDVNQDGVLNNADIDAFVAGWRSTDLPLGREGYKKGDLNFDRQTDLADAFLLHQAFLGQGAGASLESLIGGAQVPEPATGVLCMIALIPVVAGRRRRR